MMLGVVKNWIKLHPALKHTALFATRLLSPLIFIKPGSLFGYVRFFRDLKEYKGRNGSDNQTNVLDWYPCLHDRTATHHIDSHYFYQDIWAFKKVQHSGTVGHVDVGSRDIYVGMLTTATRVTFVDIRPLNIQGLDNYLYVEGSILSLPFSDGSVNSLSCLHVAEHIGLGRYGDPIDPAGTMKACSELARILAPGGNLYFSVPIGRARVCFNAHRVFNASQILNYFSSLYLKEFSGVNDRGQFEIDRSLGSLDQEDYGLGLFWFTKPHST